MFRLHDGPGWPATTVAREVRRESLLPEVFEQQFEHP
jgi:hypothetical protein